MAAQTMMKRWTTSIAYQRFPFQAVMKWGDLTAELIALSSRESYCPRKGLPALRPLAASQRTLIQRQEHSQQSGAAAAL
jgi:hypothetical protein